MCCTWLRPGHLSVHIGSHLRRSEEIVKISNCAYQCNDDDDDDDDDMQQCISGTDLLWWFDGSTSNYIMVVVIMIICVCVCVSMCVCVCVNVCVCVCICLSVCLSSLVCMVGVIFVSVDTVYWFYGYSFLCLFGHLLFWVSYIRAFCICTCSEQLSMFHMERHSRNMLIIILLLLLLYEWEAKR